MDGLDLAVPAGGVHGFLGPNGSGKTTTIRMLLGLARATSGSMRLLGADVPGRLPAVIDRVGAVVESPKFAPHFTGRQNLTLLARTMGAGTDAVDRALATVSLAGRDRDRYKSYSLGMKQRLAIAATLLKDPELLILDEPTNGLDPAGIREIRDTIRELGASGRDGPAQLPHPRRGPAGVHLGHDHRQRPDARLGHGRRAARDVGDDVPAAWSPIRCGARHVLVAAGFAVATAPTGVLSVDGDRPPDDVSRILGERGHWVAELTPVRVDLETFFLDLTRDEQLGVA